MPFVNAKLLSMQLILREHFILTHDMRYD